MRTILCCLMVQLSSLLLAQDRPITYQKFDWNDQIEDWVLIRDVRSVYDERDSLRKKINLGISDPLSQEERQIETTMRYDLDGERFYRLWQERSPSGPWRNQQRERFYTSPEGELVFLRERWRDEQWKTDYRRRTLTQQLGEESSENTFREYFG
ncbi:MAG: hypothetical protein AAGM67_18445, partial [Bacteroidota bacterium]